MLMMMMIVFGVCAVEKLSCPSLTSIDVSVSIDYKKHGE